MSMDLDINALPLSPLWENDPGSATMAHLPADNGTGASIVVCPGGGYAYVSPREGAPIARWLNRLGIDAFILNYHVGPAHHHPTMLHDVLRAMRVARSRAADPNRVGVLGFSAGGHLAACASTLYTAGSPDAADPVERLDSRPNLCVLAYPVITLDGPFAHVGSRNNLLGDAPAAGLVEELSLHKRVTAATPHTFLFHTSDDSSVPVENSLMYASALRAAGVPFELHCFEHGRHGVALAEDDPVLSPWTTLCARWLHTRGFARLPAE